MRIIVCISSLCYGKDKQVIRYRPLKQFVRTYGSGRSCRSKQKSLGSEIISYCEVWLQIRILHKKLAIAKSVHVYKIHTPTREYYKTSFANLGRNFYYIMFKWSTYSKECLINSHLLVFASDSDIKICEKLTLNSILNSRIYVPWVCMYSIYRHSTCSASSYL